MPVEGAMHGLTCRKRWRRVITRHDLLRNVLFLWFNAMPYVQAWWEPRLDNEANSYRRVDVRVEQGGPKPKQIEAK